MTAAADAVATEVVARYEGGGAVSDIAESLGCTKKAVYSALKRRGVPLRKLDEARIVEMYKEGVAIAVIASTTKSSWTTVYRVLNQYNVPRRKGLDGDRQEQIIEMYQAGVKIPEIQRQVGCGKSAVWRALRRAGVERTRKRPAGGRPAPLGERADEIVAAYRAGRTMDAIAEEFQGTRTGVRYVLVREGVELREHQGGKPRRVFTPAELDRIKELREAGGTIDSVARELRSSFVPVRDVLMPMGLHRTAKPLRYVDNHGYVVVRDEHDRRALEHRLVMGRSLGRKLRSNETVHHIDGDKTNNALSNLQLRQGKHGKGVVMTCNACGSHDVSAAEIAAS